jgi:hypothetical protein
VADSPQTGGANVPGDLDRVQRYQRLVLEYEALDEEIDALLARNRGVTEQMSDEDYERYRELAHHRDYVYNQVKELESQILLDDETDQS